MEVWICWGAAAGLLALSVALLMGKGSFLIAGYNTASQEEKRRYDKKKLCRTVGGGMGVLAVMLGIAAFYRFALPAAVSWILPWGLLGTLAVVLALTCTVCRRPDGGKEP